MTADIKLDIPRFMPEEPLRTSDAFRLDFALAALLIEAGVQTLANFPADNTDMPLVDAAADWLRKRVRSPHCESFARPDPAVAQKLIYAGVRELARPGNKAKMAVLLDTADWLRSQVRAPTPRASSHNRIPARLEWTRSPTSRE